MINDVDIPLAKIMRPSPEEFNDFEQFIENLDQEKIFSNNGLVKVIPPAKWKPRKTPYLQDFESLSVHAPIEQNVQGKSGVYELFLIQKKSMKLNDYRKKVECFDHLTDEKEIEEVEEMFWKSIAFSPPLYGADMAGTLFEPGTPWDLRDLPGVLKEGLKNPIAGVNNPYLYVGSWKTMFGWHKEDLDLYSINYNHWGKPKFWYCIPTSESHKLENFAKQYFNEGFSRCKEFLRHKTIMINPYLLKQKIPDLIIHKVAQYPGEFVITSGGAYHAGFNWGFNIAEAVNFASTKWLEILPTVKSCTCVKDSVKMSKPDFYANILMSNKYGKIPNIKKLCQENGVTKAKLDAMKLEQDEVHSVETTDSRDDEAHRKKRKPAPGGRMSAFITTQIKKIPSTKVKHLEQDEEIPSHGISTRSKKIKKLKEELDPTDWKKGPTTRHGRNTRSSK